MTFASALREARKTKNQAPTMNDESAPTSPKGPAFPPGKPTTTEPTVACTVLVSGTTIGKAKLAAGHKLHLPKSKAEALAGLTPPLVKITGI